MEKISYPYTAWVLAPSFKPKQVEILKRYSSYSPESTWELSDSGKFYLRSDLSETKELAIASGWKRVEAMQLKLDKMEDSLRKKRAALNLAAVRTA